MPAGTAGTSQHASAEEVVQHSELTTFQTREAYVYKIPPASTVGHRAEMWDVDHWLQASGILRYLHQFQCLYDMQKLHPSGFIAAMHHACICVLAGCMRHTLLLRTSQGSLVSRHKCSSKDVQMLCTTSEVTQVFRIRPLHAMQICNLAVCMILLRGARRRFQQQW